MGDVEEGNSGRKWGTGKGGFKACSFVFALTSLENMGFIAIMVSLYLYFYGVMSFNIPDSANTLTNFLGSTFLLTIFSGFISDTYLNRYYTILLFGSLETLALVLMAVQARYPSLHPAPGSGGVEGGVAAMLYVALCMLAMGAGGVRGALPSLGADQFDQDDPEEAKSLGSYFNWLTLVTVIGATIGVSLVVRLMIYGHWYKGFIVCAVATFVGLIVLASGKSFYRLRQPGDSPILGIVQVFVLAVKNRKITLPEKADQLYETTDKASADSRIAHTNQFRCLDKAAILESPEGAAGCTVTQVEEVKVLIRMLPILASTVIMNTCLAQLQTFSVQQGSTMDLRLGSGNFEVPPPSIPVIPLLFMAVLIPIYQSLFVPAVRRLTGHPSGITELQRVGVGLVLSVASMAVAGFVEVKRRNRSLEDPHHLRPISLFWLSFQFAIFGVADMFTLVGLLEFFYKEAPAWMKSLSTSFTWLSLALGYFLSSVFVNVINAVTKRASSSKQAWIDELSLDISRLDLFYWFLAVLSCLNFFIYLYWASWYKYKSTSPSSNLTTANCCLDRPKEVEQKLGSPTPAAEDDTVPKKSGSGPSGGCGCCSGANEGSSNKDDKEGEATNNDHLRKSSSNDDDEEEASSAVPVPVSTV